MGYLWESLQVNRVLAALLLITLVLGSGCSLLPEITHQPQYHNPFPQLSKVAIAPFFNLSGEATLDGRRVAQAYFYELQSVPGFEVVPVHVVETAMRDYRIELRGAEDARRLAQILDVDAILVGAVTDYSPYYPPRMSMQVEWYAANPNFHPIPPGYGLPWGTTEEDRIPGPLIFEAEFALAKAQMKTQTPSYEKLPIQLPSPEPPKEDPSALPNWPAGPNVPGIEEPNHWRDATSPDGTVRPAGHQQIVGDDAVELGLPPDWPDPRGFVPPPPLKRPPKGHPTNEPVIKHTKAYHGHDADFTEALSSYYYFRNDARFGGWQSYLQRSDDFVRFCCHMHIAETLTARGGAGQTRVVWRWPTVR